MRLFPHDHVPSNQERTGHFISRRMSTEKASESLISFLDSRMTAARHLSLCRTLFFRFCVFFVMRLMVSSSVCVTNLWEVYSSESAAVIFSSLSFYLPPFLPATNLPSFLSVIGKKDQVTGLKERKVVSERKQSKTGEKRKRG